MYRFVASSGSPAFSFSPQFTVPRNCPGDAGSSGTVHRRRVGGRLLIVVRLVCGQTALTCGLIIVVSHLPVRGDTAGHRIGSARRSSGGTIGGDGFLGRDIRLVRIQVIAV